MPRASILGLRIDNRTTNPLGLLQPPRFMMADGNGQCFGNGCHNSSSGDGFGREMSAGSLAAAFVARRNSWCEFAPLGKRLAKVQFEIVMVMWFKEGSRLAIRATSYPAATLQG
jgi:hypothetical protein